MSAGEGEADAQTPATGNNSGYIGGLLPATIVPFTAIHDGATVLANDSTSFPVYSSTDGTLAATHPADAPPSSSKRRLFGQTLTFSLQASSAATANMSPGSSGSGAPTTPRKSPSHRLADSTATSMDTDTSKKLSPASKKTPRAKTRQARSRDKSATGSSPASSAIKKRERTRRKPAPKPVTPPKKKVRILKYYIWAPKSPRANTELPEHHDGAFGAVFNPYGLQQPKFRLPEFSSLGHSTSKTSSVSVPQQAFGYYAVPSASGRRNSSSPLFMERQKPLVIKKSKANGGAKTIKSASKAKARASSASPPKTTKKARNATAYPPANGSAGSSANKAIRRHAGGSKNTTYMENFARSKASAAATQDTAAAANGHKKRRRPSVSTKRSRSASASRASASAQDDSSQAKTSVPSTPPPRKQRAAIAPMMTSAATIKAYYNSATPAKRRSRSRSRSRSTSTSGSGSASSTAAKTTQDDDGEEEQRPKKKLKKDTDTRTTTKAKRKADSTSNLPRNTFMYSSTPTQSDDGANGAEPPKKKLKKKVDTRTTKAKNKRKASGSTSNLPNKFMYSSTPTQSDDGGKDSEKGKDSVVGGDTPQSKRVRKNGGGGRRDAARSVSPTARGKGEEDKARSSAYAPVAGYDGADDDDVSEEWLEILASE